MTQIAEDELVAAIDTEIIQEILYRYGALQEWKLAAAMATNLLALAPVVYPVTPDDIKLTVTLFQQYAPKGVRARDLIHVAVMRNNGLTHVISTDTHFDQITGVTRLDPVQLYAGRQP